MSSPIIEVKGISKCYQLGTIGATRLRDDLERAWHRLTGKAEKPDEREFWALRDVSFEVQPGEIVGIIGRNGAGKSTLLKILSRITEPSSGEIVLRGRVASLLEVGTGFVGDLSGRENVFLNGAILGMTKAEIRSKFDEIVAFAEIDQFIDTPVKRYSSGMYVRLAFAVAAHLEPEILIVDEVLAVGDAQFQKKCLGKMKNVSEREGRTVLFVSHNMAAVKTLCTRGILLGGGSVLTSGETAKVVGEHSQCGHLMAKTRSLWIAALFYKLNSLMKLNTLTSIALFISSMPTESCCLKAVALSVQTTIPIWDITT
jgi:lipopolysaccharide transport system ATP-binding protein